MNCLPLAWLIKGDFYSTRNWSNPAGEQWPQGLRAPCRGQSPWPGSGPLAGVRVLLGGTGADLGKSAEQSAWGAALRPAGSPQGSCQTFLGPGPRLSWKGLPTWRTTRAGQAQVTEAARTVLGTEQLCRARWCRHHHRHMPLN